MHMVRHLWHSNQTVLGHATGRASAVGHCSEGGHREKQLRVVLALAESKHRVAMVRPWRQHTLEVGGAAKLVVGGVVEEDRPV